jgi:Cof subfamily protein (haloacid dehalogenase superfamily)
MKFDLFISDYDGTLGHAPENNIDPETLSAINKFTEKGGIFAVCSGRETTSISRILKASGLKGLVVSFQGAKISDVESGESILEGGLSVEKTLEVLEMVAKYDGLTALCYGEDDFFYESKNEYVKSYEKAINLEGRATDVIKTVKENNRRVYKALWLGDNALVNKVADEMNAIYKGNGVIFNSGGTHLLEAINPEYSKGHAVRYLAKKYGIPLERVITIGDSTNDISLLQGEWHGVAVGDGRDELKAVAKEITVPFKDKPVKAMLEKYCLD